MTSDPLALNSKARAQASDLPLMTRPSFFTAALAVALAMPAAAVHAHSFSEPYLLPVPFWLYVYGCAATLVLTFAVLGYFLGSAGTVRGPRLAPPAWIGGLAIAGPVLAVARGAALACLALTIVAGYAGVGDPNANIAMPLFWVIFLLGFTYVNVVAGDLFELVNPWRTLASMMTRVMPGFTQGRIAYPQRLGYYPAFAFYLALIWIELFVLPRPATLATALVAYTALTLLGTLAFGSAAWFRHGEMFGVFFRLVSVLSPVAYSHVQNDGERRHGESSHRRSGDGESRDGAPRDHRWQVHLRAPSSGALAMRVEHMALVLFILFMLSSTTFDAIHDTELWVGLYWQHLIMLAKPLWGPDMVKAQSSLMPWYAFYQRAGLLLSPFAYLVLYLLMLAWAKQLARTGLALRQLALEFSPSLIPIAIVYNITHYYTMLVTQLDKFDRVMSDPLGFGWNLLGLGTREPGAALNMAVIWHTQVGLILAGHVISVYLAHAIALRVFPTRRQVIVSQLPLLLLMLAYTAAGLYILSLPLAIPVAIE